MGVEKGEKGEKEKASLSPEEKLEKVKAIDALIKQGYSIKQACEVVGVPRTTYYSWKEELAEKLGYEAEPKKEKKDDIQSVYDFLSQYGFTTAEPQKQQQQTQDPVEELVQLKKKLDRARAILGGGEGVSAPAGGEELEEIKKAIGYLLKRIEELQRGQVYMGRVKKVRYPDGTEIEYDLMPTDYATVKQANTMYDRVVPEALNELKGMRQDLTMFANRLLGLIEANFTHEIKKAPGFFLSFRKRSKEERERELEEIEKKLEEKEKELMSLKIGGGEGEVSAGDVGEGGSR